MLPTAVINEGPSTFVDRKDRLCTRAVCQQGFQRTLHAPGPVAQRPVSTNINRSCWLSHAWLRLLAAVTSPAGRSRLQLTARFQASCCCGTGQHVNSVARLSSPAATLLLLVKLSYGFYVSLHAKYRLIGLIGCFGEFGENVPLQRRSSLPVGLQYSSN